MKKTNLLNYCFLFFLVGCFDVYTPTKRIAGPYFLMQSETGNWGLYYDLGGGSGIGRVTNLTEIGWTDKYIFAKEGNNFYFLDKTKDSLYYNAGDIVKGPFNSQVYSRFLDSLELNGFRLHKP